MKNNEAEFYSLHLRLVKDPPGDTARHRFGIASGGGPTGVAVVATGGAEVRTKPIN